MTIKNYEVLIVGAGMVGATVATALGMRGISVAVFDHALPAPLPENAPPELRVSALNYASEQILRNLGAWTYIENVRTCPYRQMAVWEKLHHLSGQEVESRPNTTHFDAVDTGLPQLGFIVENRVTQLGLLQAMAAYDSVKLFSSVSIENIDLSSGHSKVTLNDGQTFSGLLLVGADGADSGVRSSAGLGLEQKDYEQKCLVTTVEIEGGCQDITWQAFTPTGPEAFLPLPDIDGRSYGSVVWYNLPEKVQRLLALPDQAFITELSNTFPKELPSIKKVLERGAFPLAKRHAVKYFRRGVVLAGDAAHTINPLAGQGVNLGFQDAAWLAQIIGEAIDAGENPGSVEVLTRYSKIRRPQNQRMMSLMDGFYHTFSNDNNALKLIRNIGLAMAGKATPATKQVMKYAMGLTGEQPELAKTNTPIA